MIKYLLLLLILFIVGCKEGPDVAVCIVDPDTDSLQCSKDGQGFVVPIKDASDYYAIQFDDFKKVLDYCKIKQGGQINNENNSSEPHPIFK